MVRGRWIGNKPSKRFGYFVIVEYVTQEEFEELPLYVRASILGGGVAWRYHWCYAMNVATLNRRIG